MKTNPLILRVVLMVCISLGELFPIIATAGKECLKRADIYDGTYTVELWNYCYKKTYYYDSDTLFSPVNRVLRKMKSSMKGNYFLMSIEIGREYKLHYWYYKIIQS